MDGVALDFVADEEVPAPTPACARVAEFGEPDADGWDNLAANASEPNPFYERWFLRSSLRHLSRDDDVRLLTVREGARVLGLVPIVRHQGYARMPLRLWTNWEHYHSFLGTPLVRRGAEAAFWRAALARLNDEDGAELLHFSGLVEGGPVLAALAQTGRTQAVVQRHERAFLHTELPADAYYAATVRKKKRKELGRLQKRFAELGHVETRRLGADDEAAPWVDDFLALEASGWKGEGGSALGCDPATRAFFGETVAAAHARGQLDAIRLDLDGRAAAMLWTFIGRSAGGPGGFSYKIAYDEALARFSPGVLLQIANGDLPQRRGLAWVDSCAAEGHPMIDSLWGERRALVRVTLPRDTVRGRAAFHLARTAERASAALRARKEPA